MRSFFYLNTLTSDNDEECFALIKEHFSTIVWSPSKENNLSPEIIDTLLKEVRTNPRGFRDHDPAQRAKRIDSLKIPFVSQLQRALACNVAYLLAQMKDGIPLDNIESHNVITLFSAQHVAWLLLIVQGGRLDIRIRADVRESLYDATRSFLEMFHKAIGIVGSKDDYRREEQKLSTKGMRVTRKPVFYLGSNEVDVYEISGGHVATWTVGTVWGAGYFLSSFVSGENKVVLIVTFVIILMAVAFSALTYYIPSGEQPVFKEITIWIAGFFDRLATAACGAWLLAGIPIYRRLLAGRRFKDKHIIITESDNPSRL
jgi:hypothetical protein